MLTKQSHTACRRLPHAPVPPLMTRSTAACHRTQRRSTLRWSAVILALWLSLVAPSGAAEPATFRLALGAAKPHEHLWATTISVGLERDWRPFHGGRLSWDGMLMAFDRREGEGGAAELDRSVQMVAAGLRWRRGGFINGFAVGLATPRTAAISGPLQFVTTLGYGLTHWAVLVQHVSNAGFTGRNHGETMLMLEWTPGAR
jgi:hypothetical protein